MDARPEPETGHPLALAGWGHVVVHPDRGEGACDPRPFLKQRKMGKYMAPQDELALVATGRALESAGLAGTPLGEATGLYLAVGFIPFEGDDIDALLSASVQEGRVTMAAYTTDGLDAVSPLLTFRCLPNMPAFHISFNFDVQGPYLTTYPGPGQFYQALDQACTALERGEVERAVVVGVAHQRNFLVEHHFSRVRPATPADRLADGAGAIILERAGGDGSPGGARLIGARHDYGPLNPFEGEKAPGETFSTEPADALAGLPDLGAASLPAAVSMAAAAGAASLHHRVETRDNFTAESTWALA